MNAKERNNLAYIVSEMLYSSTSTSQVVDAGRTILNQFPSIQRDLDLYRAIQCNYNLGKAALSSIWAHWDSTLTDPAYKGLFCRAVGESSDLFSTYIDYVIGGIGVDDEDLDFEVRDARVIELDLQMGQCFSDYEVWQMLRPMIESAEWIEAVRSKYSGDAKLINFLTVGAVSV